MSNNTAPDLRAALLRLLRSFPADSDMQAAGWDSEDISEACDAYDAARAALAAAPAAIPEPRQPLTDEQIRNINNTDPITSDPPMIKGEHMANIIDFARAVELAHGIGAAPAAEPPTQWTCSKCGALHDAGGCLDAHEPTAPAAEQQTGPRWRHVTGGGTYAEVGRGKLKCEPGSWRDAIVYRSELDGALYVRPVEQFNDGRFERIGGATGGETA